MGKINIDKLKKEIIKNIKIRKLKMEANRERKRKRSLVKIYKSRQIKTVDIKTIWITKDGGQVIAKRECLTEELNVASQKFGVNFKTISFSK